MVILIHGFTQQLPIIASTNALALNIADQLMLKSEAPRPAYISPERQAEIYTEVRQMEEAFIAALESTGAMTPKRLAVIRSRFAVIQVEMMRPH